MKIKSNIASILNSLHTPARLVVVSKMQPMESLREAYAAGQRIFGENKVQELVRKQPQLPSDAEWHFIGHLQRNKVKLIAPFISLIHSADSFSLLEEIDKQAQKVNRQIPCLLQVHIAREETKFGFSEEEVWELVNSGKLSALKHAAVAGLMGMASFTSDEERVRAEFRRLRQLFDKIKNAALPNVVMRELSMGMSGDYKIAAEEGSTLVRVGSRIFVERKKN